MERRKRARQIIDFAGLTDGRLGPTDIDGVYDLHGRAFMFFEFKYDGAPVPTGQRIALENLVKACGDAGRPAVAVVVDHYQREGLLDVDAAAGIVRETYWHNFRKWHKPPREITLAEALEAFKKEAHAINN